MGPVFQRSSASRKHLECVHEANARSSTGNPPKADRAPEWSWSCQILLPTKKSSIPELVPDDIAEMKYHKIPDDEKWKIPIIKELIEVKNRTLEVETFRMAEID